MSLASHHVIVALVLAAAVPALAQETPPAPIVHHGPMDVAPPKPPPEPALELTSPQLLPRPFTAAQICAELTPGLIITWRITSAAGVQRQRWTVVESDAENVTIEHAVIDEGGTVLTEPTRRTTSCAELRNHATYPRDRATRDELQAVETPLGPLDGWLYRLREKEEGIVSGFFFSKAHPGAPIFARTLRGEMLLSEMVQVARERVPVTAPATPPDEP